MMVLNEEGVLCAHFSWTGNQGMIMERRKG